MSDDVDDLDGEALEIATRYLLDRWTLKQLADSYHRSPATLHRRLAKWLDDRRFELADTRAAQTHPRVVDIDEHLSDALSDRSDIWRAHVAVIEGAGEAYSEEYLGPDDGVDAQRAFEAHDRLHQALGQAASSYFASRLRRGMTIGVSSGRGVGFLIMGLADLAQERPSLLRGYRSIQIESLCGGARVGAWALPTVRALDADENVFQLSSILGVPRSGVTYMRGWISGEQRHDVGYSDSPDLDMALVGLEVLNTRHQFFLHHDQNVQLGAIAPYIETLKELQADEPALLDSVAGIAHHFFPTGGREYPGSLLRAVEGINKEVLVVPPERIRTADEVIMVAGGAQKLNALVDLLDGRCPSAPVNLENLTLVTDAWTAEQMLGRLG
ncbi:MAG: hypothetical protein F4X72_15025 [Dehalococcoidia bacterium]|nr:hypothetical protein [Dehalococcoidia bacterium]